MLDLYKHHSNPLFLFFKRGISFALVLAFILSQSPIQAQVLGLPKAGTMVDLSPAYVPVLIKGLKVHQDNPFAMDFIVDTGDTGWDQPQDKVRLSKESEKLIKYFLAALTLPERDVWVNLSPYEKDRIVPAELGQTEMGRDMLAEDYLLKQITASLIYPEKQIGQEFWNNVYAQAYQKFGTTQIPVNTFNKVWIVADKATVYENTDTALVVNSHLKVMLEEDYLALQKHAGVIGRQNTQSVASRIVRSIILPALEKEVNEGKNFANLRQIFNSLILAKWYKQALKEAILNQVYSNKNKIAGVQVKDKAITAKIYAQYLEAYKKGVFNFIKEDQDQMTRQPLPRKYFSGGVVGALDLRVTHNFQDTAQAVQPKGRFVLVEDVMGRARDSAAENQNQTQAALKTYLTDRGFDLSGGQNPFDNNPTVNASPRDVALLSRYADLQVKRDAAMANNIWERGDYKENVYTSFSATNALVVLTEDERKDSEDITRDISGWNDIVNRAKNYLEVDQRVGDFEDKPINIQVKRVFRDLPFGYAIDHDHKIIYLSPQLQLRLRKEGREENFDFFARKVIFLLRADPLEGQRYEYQYAYEKFTQRVLRLFPPGSEPTQLLGQISDGNLLKDRPHGEEAYQKLAQQIMGLPQDQFQFIPVNQLQDVYDVVRGEGEESRKIALIEAGDSGIKANEEVLSKAQDALYIIGLNALDKVTDYIKAEGQSTGQFSSKFNPVTIAQMNIAILYAYAISAAASYGVNVSEFDPRKPDVHKSYAARLAIAQTEIRASFHGLVKIIPSADDIRQWNGEEVAVIRASKIHVKKYRYIYTVGGDHFYIWAPFDAGDNNNLSGLIGFDEIHDSTRPYYSFWAGIGKGKEYGLSWKEYQDLVRKQFDRKGEGEGERKFFDTQIGLTDAQKKNPTLDMKERAATIDRILHASNESEMENIFETAKILPRLDSVGKMILAGKALPDIDFVVAHTVRNYANFKDKLRDEFIKNELKVFNIDGLNADVAATRTRDGLIAYLYGIVNFNLLYGASKPTLQLLFDKKDRRPLETILRQSSLTLPNSIAIMLHDKEDEHNDLFSNLKVSLQDKMGDVKVDEATTRFTIDSKDRIAERGESIITIVKDNDILFEISYNIVNTVDQEGRPQNRLVYKIDLDNLDKSFSFDVHQAVIDYISQYNDVTDSAMASLQRMPAIDHTASSPGGIDLNGDQMQMDVRKQGAGLAIHFDPALLKQFQGNDFQGFVPIIINITPITNLAPLIGLAPQEADKARV